MVNVLRQFKQTSRTKFVNLRRELANIQSYYYALFWMFVHSYSKRAKEVAELLFQLNFEKSEGNKMDCCSQNRLVKKVGRLVIKLVWYVLE